MLTNYERFVKVDFLSYNIFIINFTKNMKNLNYNIILKPEKEGGFTVIVPSLPGCVTYGKDLNEAKKMALDAIKGYIKSLAKHKEPIPNDDTSYVTNINFNLPIAQKLKYA